MGDTACGDSMTCAERSSLLLLVSGDTASASTNKDGAVEGGDERCAERATGVMAGSAAGVTRASAKEGAWDATGTATASYEGATAVLADSDSDDKTATGAVGPARLDERDTRAECRGVEARERVCTAAGTTRGDAEAASAAGTAGVA